MLNHEVYDKKTNKVSDLIKQFKTNQDTIKKQQEEFQQQLLTQCFV